MDFFGLQVKDDCRSSDQSTSRTSVWNPVVH
jgi:hypothetical protein